MYRSLLFVPGLLLAFSGPVAAIEDDTSGLEGTGATTDTVQIEALRKKSETEGQWGQDKRDQIQVNQAVLREPWHRVPFEQKPFDYSPEQIRENWDRLLGNFQMPYPSAAFLRQGYERFPAMRKAHPDFDGDYVRLERQLDEVWREFLRGDYQQAMASGRTLGPMGIIAGKVSQLFYAIYLEPDLDKKHMLLQDAANTIRNYGEVMDQMRRAREPIYRDTYVVGRIGYVYAIGRIAEDVPIPVAIGHNYVFKVLGALHDIRDLAPENPLGLAAAAGADANVVRKVGKATGRITFGARQATIRENFEKALKKADLAVIRYEYANAILYLNKKRDIDEAIGQLKRAQATRPRFAMEALDAMYASKRLREVEALAKSSASFRSFERERTRYMRDNNQNLYCVLPGACKPFIIQ